MTQIPTYELGNQPGAYEQPQTPPDLVRTSRKSILDSIMDPKVL